MADEWHYATDGNQHGPVSASELKQLAVSGTLGPSDLVWKEGMGEWKPASRVKGLFPKSDESSKSATPPKQPPPAQANQDSLPPAQSPPPSPVSADTSDNLVMPSDPPKDPIIMAAVSFVIPWLGQIVLGQVAKGIVMFALSPFIHFTFFMLVGWIERMSGGGFDIPWWLMTPLLAGIIALDSYFVARTLKSGEPVGKWRFFPGLDKQLQSVWTADPSTLLPNRTQPDEGKLREARPKKQVIPKPDGFMPAAIAMFVPAVTAGLFAVYIFFVGFSYINRMFVLAACVSLAYNGWVIFGAFATIRLKSYKLAQITSYMTFGCWACLILGGWNLFPFIAGGMLISVPTGIWSQLVLRRDDVKAAFERSHS
jgi:hypothetical protein